MKKLISIILILTMFTSVIYPCQSVIAAEIKQNNALTVSENIIKMTDEYNTEYEEKLDNSDSESITVDNRLIVETKSKINTYDSVDEVYGLGYAFIQFDNEEDTQKAAFQYKKQGLTVSNDRIYNLNATSYANFSNDEKWAYTFTESDTTVKYFKNKKLSDVTVGIIDSGIDYTHSLLKSRVLRTNTNFSTSGNQNDEMDDQGHGTSCAGIIAQATTDNVKIQGFKAGSADGHVYTSSLICTYEYILNMNEKPDVINMSFGGYGKPLPTETQLLEELKKSGIALIASAGNENLDTADSTPANDENVFAVSAFDPNGVKCFFSNYGTTVDIAAPGTNVYTSKLGGGYTNSFTGTSASAPFVSAAAAIVLMQNNTLTPDEVYEKIKASAFNTNKPADKLWAGAGLLNYFNLIDGDRKSPVTFNYEGGQYDDTIKVELTSADRLNTKIIYTTDNTLPSASNGTKYSGPITIDTHATIIAAAFPIVGSSLHSQYTSASYQIFRNADENDFEITDDGTITSYNGKYVAIKVPDTIKGITPTAIGENCFKNSDIVNIELPKTIDELKSNAFENSSLQRIVAEGVESCWNTAVFKNCFSLNEEYMPNITYLGEEAFYNCSMINTLSFKDNLKTAEIQCLSGTGITEADFPNLTYINRAFESTPVKTASLPKLKDLNGAFRGCTLLESVYIPNVYKIGEYAFGGCVSLPQDMDFSKITEVGSNGFAEAPFEIIDLPNCTKLWGCAFKDAFSKTINLPMCKTLGGGDFTGEYIETVNIENAESIESTIDAEFINAFSLKNIYAPKLKQVPAFDFDDVGLQQIKNGKKPVIEYIYAPSATKFNYKRSNFKACDKLDFLFAPNLENISGYFYFPEKDNFTLYLSDSLKVGTNLESNINGKYTVVAPTGSFAEQWAKKEWIYYPDGLNFVPSDSRAVDENNKDLAEGINTHAKGKSICTSVAGLRFGFDWTAIPEVEELASNIEYGFIYSQKGAENLSIDTVDNKNVKRLVANNRVTNGDNTSFNLVIANIPDSYQSREITARAYVCIDGMYFYSNLQNASFKSVADLVLADDEIDLSTKNAVKNLLAKEA